MTNLLLIIFCCFCIALCSATTIFAQKVSTRDSLVKFEPNKIEAYIDSTGFVQGYISVHNLSETDTLRIPQITPSCYCGMSTIMNSFIPPKEQGKIYLAVNTKQFKNPLNSVEYKVYTSFTSKPVKLYFDCKQR